MDKGLPFRNIGLALCCCLMIFVLPFETGLGDEQISPGEAKIRFLGHCGFAVQTENHLLIFDYVEKRLEGKYEEPETRSLSTGYINSAEIEDRKVSVFVTHSHTDHYDPVIFDWEDIIPDIKYFFGWQATEEPQYNYLIGPKAEWEDEEMRIYTVNSHHSGVPEVAYLVLVDGLAIYHNGDCKADYKEDMPYLKSKTDHLDIAFVHPVWEEKWDYYWITLELINQMQPQAVFPMHVRVGDEEKYFKPFKSVYQPKMKSGEVVLTRNKKGAAYLYKDGEIILE
ncbi:MAG: MBL fold metallo-hydrolase [Candidatus Zixiibacteriota bacterium]|nr:MAG: MBL fold metallo-hydrolase [candidate division Zixibacteria bacterium]